MIYRWFKDDLKESLDEGRDNSRSHFVLAVLCPDQPRCHHPPGYFKVVIDVKNMFQLYRHHDYNLYSFLARLPLHIFWRKMMMPGINWDRAFSSSNRVEGDLSRNHSHLHHSSSTHWRLRSLSHQKSLSSAYKFFHWLTIDYLTKTFVLPKVTSFRNCRSSRSTLLTIVIFSHYNILYTISLCCDWWWE